MMHHPRHVVFLPGFMCDARLFAHQISALREAGIDASVGDLTEAASIERMAAQVLAAAPDRFALVGLSMGGIVAFEILRQAPGRVTHLGLLNTTPKSDQAGPTRVQQMRRVIDGQFADVLREELKPQYLAVQNQTADRLELIYDMGRRLGPDVFTRQTIALMGRRGSEDMLGSVTCPTLVLTGAYDAVCTPKIHEAMAASIPHAQLEVIPRCGHLSSLEQPDAVTHHLLSLLDCALELPSRKAD
ncbi:MAG: alpha/beta hydrolase [Pseudomonadota bacterium]